jgi:hypothetical protein
MLQVFFPSSDQEKYLWSHVIQAIKILGFTFIKMFPDFHGLDIFMTDFVNSDQSDTNRNTFLIFIVQQQNEQCKCCY